MASRRVAVLLSALLGALVLAPSTEAHTLKVPRAAKANRTFAKLVCDAAEGEGGCVASRPGRCRRLSAHRVRCVFFLTLSLEDGSRGRCRSLIDWYIRNRNARLHPNYLGVRNCVQLRPPEAEEPSP